MVYNLSYYKAVVYIENAQTLQGVFHWVAWNKSMHNIRWLHLCWWCETVSWEGGSW